MSLQTIKSKLALQTRKSYFRPREKDEREQERLNKQFNAEFDRRFKIQYDPIPDLKPGWEKRIKFDPNKQLETVKCARCGLICIPGKGCPRCAGVIPTPIECPEHGVQCGMRYVNQDGAQGDYCHVSDKFYPEQDENSPEHCKMCGKEIKTKDSKWLVTMFGVKYLLCGSCYGINVEQNSRDC